MLSSIVISLISEPELATLPEAYYEQEKIENRLKVISLIFHFKLNGKNNDTFLVSAFKMNSLVLDLTIVSALLFWEILHFLGLNSWNSTDFNLEICVKLIENSKYFVNMQNKKEYIALPDSPVSQ